MASVLYNLVPFLWRLEVVKETPPERGPDFIVFRRQDHDRRGADGCEQIPELPLGVAVETLDGNAVIEGGGVLSSGVYPCR